MSISRNWDRISRINHWLVAGVMIAMLAFGVYLEEFVPRGPDKGALLSQHKAIGVLILIFGLWRVGYRLMRGFLAEAAPMPKWQSLVARIVHWVLLIAVLAMPISGLLGSYFNGRDVDVFGLFTIGGALVPDRGLAQAFMGIHGVFGKLTIFALVLHVIGAVKHHISDKDDTLKRMLGRA